MSSKCMHQILAGLEVAEKFVALVVVYGGGTCGYYV